MKLSFSINLLLFFLFFSCQSDQSDKDNKQLWADTQEVQLLGESTKLKLPKKFKRSSRFKISKDIPLLEQDTLLKKYIEANLEGVEFEDEKIDVFVDTTKTFRFIRLVNMEKVEVNKLSADMLSSVIKQKYEEVEKNSYGIEVTKLVSEMKNNSKQHLLMFKYKMYNKVWDAAIYETTYFVITKYRTIVVNEYSNLPLDIEPYLWSVKEG